MKNIFKKFDEDYMGFIDKNPALAVGTILPILLFILFLLLAMLGNWFESYPKYNPVFSVEDSICLSTEAGLQLNISNGILMGKLIPPNADHSGCNRRKKLYYFDVKKRHTEDLRISVYNDYREDRLTTQKFEINELRDLKLIDSELSPDFYSFLVKKSSVVDEKLMNASNADKILIQKNGRTVDISPLGGGNRYGDREIKLLGWSLSKKGDKND